MAKTECSKPEFEFYLKSRNVRRMQKCRSMHSFVKIVNKEKKFSIVSAHFGSTQKRRYINDVNTFYSFRYENDVFDMMIRFNALC